MIWEIHDDRKEIEGLDEHGRPDPAYAAALGLRPAPYGRRALASIIEFAFYAFLQLPYWLLALPKLISVLTGQLTWAGFFSHPDLLWMIVGTGASFLLTTAFVVVQIALHGKRGATLGKAFTGIRSINVATLEQPGIGKAFLRALVLYLGFLVPLGPVLLFISPLFDREQRGRGWLDKIGGTWFVDIRDGLDPYHEKRMRVARKTVSAEPEARKSELPSLATPADHRAQAYRPGARTSSGVVGAARPLQPGAQEVGLPSHAAEPAPSHTVPGMPAGGARIGGYRPGELSGAARPVAPQPSAPAAGSHAEPARPGAGHADAPVSGGIVDSVPGRERPQQPPQPSTISDDTVIDPELDGGIDDSTVRRVDAPAPEEEDLDVTRARPSSRPIVATLAFDNGDRFAIAGAALIGRNPAPGTGEVVEHLLPVADDTRSISKTHLLITATPLAAVDRASTNGSSVVRGGVEHPLAPGAAFALVPGDVVRFGDRTVRIEAPAGGAP